METSGQATRYRFADLSLDVGLRRVARNGQALHLGKLTYEMLLALVEAAPNVVTQDRLAERVWSGRIATPETVAQRIKLLRLALSDETSEPRYVEVLRGQGYRLIPHVEREAEAASLPAGASSIAPVPARRDAAEPSFPQAAVTADDRFSRQRRSWLAAAAFLVVAGVGALVWYAQDQRNGAPPPASTPPARAAAKSIAVLPFLDLSSGQDQQYFSDGISEEILDRLANNEGQLRVIARTSSFSFRGRPVDIPEIAAKLDVSHILEGSVRRSGDRMRITAQLVNGSDGSHVWSESYDRTMGDLFAVQDDIATSVASALEAVLAGDAPGGGEPASAQSLDDYLHGKFLYNRRAPGDIELAVRYFESAVSRDPGYARAWAALSGAYSLMWWNLGLDAGVWRVKQGEAARRAVELDPELFEARMRLSQYYFDTSDLRQAVEQVRAVAAFDPENRRLADLANKITAWQAVHLDDQIAEFRDALKDDPYSKVSHVNLGLVLFAAEHLDEALAEFRRALELNPGGNWDMQLEIGRVLVAQKRFDEARAAIAQLPAEAIDYGLALLLGDAGRREAADAALARLQARSGDFMHAIRIAEALSMRGRHDEALATLQHARDTLERDESILTRIWFFQHEMRLSPFLGPLHRDRRWQALMAKPEGDSAREIIERLWPASRTAAVRE